MSDEPRDLDDVEVMAWATVYAAAVNARGAGGGAEAWALLIADEAVRLLRERKRPSDDGQSSEQLREPR